MEIEEEKRNSFESDANKLHEDKDVGTTICSGEVEQVQELFGDLTVEELKVVMTYLVD